MLRAAEWLVGFGAVYLAAAAFLPAAIRSGVLAGLYIVPGLFAVTLSWRVARQVERFERRFWVTLGLGLSAILAGEVCFGVLRLVFATRMPISPAPSDALFVLGYLVLLNVPLTMARVADAFTVRRLRYIIDLFIIMVLAVVVTYTGVLHPLSLQYPNVEPLERALSTFYPVIDIVVVLGMALSSIGTEQSFRRGWESWIAVGFVGFLVSDVLFNYTMGSGSYHPGTVSSDFISLGWVLGYGMLALGAVSRLQALGASDAAMTPETVSLARVGWPDFLVPTLVLLVSPVLLMRAHQAGPTSDDFAKYAGAAAVLAILIVLRSLTLSFENSRLLSRSLTDPLTGLYNHRHFHERLQEEIERSRRTGDTVSIVVFDIDEFNQVNNVYGHVVGDRRLRSIAGRLLQAARSVDIAARVGGDEFAIIMPATAPVEAYKACLRIREALARDDGVCEFETKASFGIAASPQHSLDREDLVRKADGALYWAKYHGRNQVVIYDEDVVSTLTPEERVQRVEEQSYLRTVEVLAAAVDARDSYTQYHSRNVAQLASMLAQKLQLPSENVKLIEIAAMLHDVGKIGVPDHILRKQGDLDVAERELIRDHPELGERILAATTFREILPWVLSHHERWDGQGYPQQLRGPQIPLEARILSVCDAYDAMTSDRPYRKGLAREQALRELQDGAGTQFDPLLVEVFVDLLLQDAAMPVYAAPKPIELRSQRQGEAVPVPADSAD